MKLNPAYSTYLTNLFKVLRSDAVGAEFGGYSGNEVINEAVELDEDGNYIVNPLDVQEVERMCIELGLSYELIEMWGIRIWSF